MGAPGRRAGGGSAWGPALDPLTDKKDPDQCAVAVGQAASGGLPPGAVWLLLAREAVASPGWRVRPGGMAAPASAARATNGQDGAANSATLRACLLWAHWLGPPLAAAWPRPFRALGWLAFLALRLLLALRSFGAGLPQASKGRVSH